MIGGLKMGIANESIYYLILILNLSKVENLKLCERIYYIKCR